MKKKNGFISMTLVYTFLILFMFLMLAILRTYTVKDKFLQAINEQINNDIGISKGSRVTVINKLIDDNMPLSDASIKYFQISNRQYGNGGNLYYMDVRNNITNYNLSEYTDENADTHTSRIYYFRGGNEGNHIVFAGMCFRIIRTNEDGSIRIIYNGTATSGSKCKKLDDMTEAPVIKKNIQFNSEENPSVEYVKIGDDGSVPSADEANVEQSPIIKVLNEWYKNSFIPNTAADINYTDYISKDAIYCNNKVSFGEGGFYKSKELAPVFINKKNKDLYNDDNIKSIVSFYCSENNDRFSVNEGTLVYPVGLPSAQDVVLAGGYLSVDGDEYEGGPDNIISNEGYYLYSSESYWTMSPLSSNGEVIYVDSDGTLKGALSNESHAVRPVISLNSNIVISSGDGSANNPYIVKTGN